MCRVLVLLANGFEEIEAITVVDLIRRAEIEVITASIHDDKTVKGSHDINVVADTLLKEIPDSEEFDMIILPGGLPGADYLNESKDVERKLMLQHNLKKNIAAICAAPKVLCAKGIATNLRITHYPNCINDLNGAKYSSELVVHDENVITSQGPGTSIDFSLKLIEILKDLSTSDEIRNQILIKS